MSPNESRPVNSVTLFSNGMGHFRRVVSVRGGMVENISIPFNRTHISDVLESLSVFGNVRLENPPSFTPTNSNSTSLVIHPSNVTTSLYMALSGAKVKIVTNDQQVDPENDVEYILLGMETENLGEDGEIQVLSVLRDGKVSRFELSDVDSVEFVEESVRTEIDKALKNNFQKIKPESTFLDLSLSGLDFNGTDAEGNDTDGFPLDETAIIQYKIPVAVWKMRYSVRQNGEKFLLEGTAIIDNNTDEDWNDVLISVVTGNPISFQSPKMAAIITPERQVLDVVDANSLGAVGVEDGVQVSASRGGRAMRLAARSTDALAYSSAASFGGAEAACAAPEYLCETSMEAASSPGVDSKEVGDFCVFTSKEVISIASKRSAIVPMFAVPLTTAGTILIYKESDHARRPFRAVKIKNEANYDLGKGKVVVYIDDVFSGESVLETAKPGEKRLLPFCLENGVRIVKTSKGEEINVSSISLAKGVMVTKTTHRRVTEYDLTNKKDEFFRLLIEHPSQMGCDSTYEFSGVDVEEIEKLTSGVRIHLELDAKQVATLYVTETFIAEHSVKVLGNYRWVRNQIGFDHPLANEAHLLNCARFQRVIDEKNRQIQVLQSKAMQGDSDVDQLRKNIEASKSAAKDSSSDAAIIQSRWVTELDELTKENKEIRKRQIPALEAERNSVQQELDAELEQMTAFWSA